MMKQLESADNKIFLTEIFPLGGDDAVKGMRLEISPSISKKLGKCLAFHLCRLDSNHVYIWNTNSIIYLTNQSVQIPEYSHHQLEILLHEATQKIEELTEYEFKIEGLSRITPDSKQISQLAYQLFRHSSIEKFSHTDQVDRVRISRKIEAGSETFYDQGKEYPAISLTVKSEIRYMGTLLDLMQSEQLPSFKADDLIGLQVNMIGVSSSGTVRDFRGTLSENRDRLLRLSSNPKIQRIIRQSGDSDLVLAVQIGKGEKLYDYPIQSLTPSITASTSKRFGVDYGALQKVVKKDLIIIRKNALREIHERLKPEYQKYGLTLKKSINSKQYTHLFYELDSKLENVQLLFGNQKLSAQSKTLAGLSAGGAYQNNNPDIRITSLRFCSGLVGLFIGGLEKQLEKYQFKPFFVYKHKPSSDFDFSLSDMVSIKIEVERVLEEALSIPSDICLVFLPDIDRNLDETNEGSLYDYLYSRIIRRGISSQFIYEKTIKQSINNVLNNIVPGIIAKTGNIPYVFAEPLTIADRFIGLDVARKALSNRTGSINACATIRIYGQRGDLISYALEDSSLEGEEIPQRVIEKVLPIDSTQKTTLVYRDGRFRGNEARSLRERADRLKAGLILVECVKSQVPRLYHLNKDFSDNLSSPPKGLAIHLSSHEAIVVSTQVSKNIGLARPLRLKVHELSDPVDLNNLIETTLKLTLLHYGSLKPPRLPIPIFGADRISGLRLKGIYPTMALHERRQFWL